MHTHNFILLVSLVVFGMVFQTGQNANAQVKQKGLEVELSGKNTVSIILPMPAQKNIRLLVTDVLGRTLKDSTISIIPEPGRISVNLSGYRQGLYFIRIYYQEFTWSNRFLYEPGSTIRN